MAYIPFNRQKKSGYIPFNKGTSLFSDNPENANSTIAIAPPGSGGGLSSIYNQNILKFGKEVAQGTARSIAKVGGTIINPLLKLFGQPEGVDIKATDESKLKKTIFGEEGASDLQQEFKDKGVGGGLLAVGGTLLDFTGFGGEKKAISNLVKETNPIKIIEILRKSKYPEELIETAAKDISIATKADEVKNVLDRGKAFVTKATEAPILKAKPFDKPIEKMTEFDVIDSLRALNSDSFVRDGKLNLDAFGETQELLDKANKAGAKLTTDEINMGRELLRLTGFTEPKLTNKITNTIADEAITYAKNNPDSSLVSKSLRNPITKELEDGPRLFKRIGEAIRKNEINIEDLPEISKRYGLKNEEVAKLFEDAASYSGRTLNALSRVEKQLKALLPDITFPKKELTTWEKFKSSYLAVDNFRRSLLVTQLATAARNAISQTGRYTIGTVTDAMNGVISTVTGKGEGFTPFFEDIASGFRNLNPKNAEKIKKILDNYPLENMRLYNTPVGDVALAGKVSNFLNSLNRGQEYFFRNLILDARLHTAAKVNKLPINQLYIDDVAKAVDDALDWTFSASPTKGSFGSAVLQLYRAMPPLTLINPFPRFMSNAIKFLYDFSPAGIMSLFSSKTRAAIASGDYSAISKAMIGTSMLGGALAIRANKELAGEKWYEIKAGDKRIDSRPFGPFSTYLLFAEVMVNGGERLSGSDWAQAAIGINRIAGTGLALVDLISDKVDTKNVVNVVNGLVSSYVGGFTVPFATIKDVIGNFKLDERTVKETKEIPIVGGAIANIPGLNTILPTKYSMFEDKPLERESPLLRQASGITLTTKPYILQELDRMGKDIGDLVPKTGNLKANRIISKQTGVILDQFNDKLEMSEKYQALDNDAKLEFLKDLISKGKSEAKGQIASELALIVYNEIKKSKSDERKDVIKKLKGRGLMTENILSYLLPMLEANPLKRNSLDGQTITTE